MSPDRAEGVVRVACDTCGVELDVATGDPADLRRLLVQFFDDHRAGRTTIDLSGAPGVRIPPAGTRARRNE